MPVGQSGSGYMVTAKSVEYIEGQIVIALSDGQSLSFAPGELQGLGEATAEQLADVEIYPGGRTLHWRDPNECFEVDALTRGITGSKKWMQRAAVA